MSKSEYNVIQEELCIMVPGVLLHTNFWGTLYNKCGWYSCLSRKKSDRFQHQWLFGWIFQKQKSRWQPDSTRQSSSLKPKWEQTAMSSQVKPKLSLDLYYGLYIFIFFFLHQFIIIVSVIVFFAFVLRLTVAGGCWSIQKVYAQQLSFTKIDCFVSQFGGITNLQFTNTIFFSF